MNYDSRKCKDFYETKLTAHSQFSTQKSPVRDDSSQAGGGVRSTEPLQNDVHDKSKCRRHDRNIVSFLFYRKKEKQKKLAALQELRT